MKNDIVKWKVLGGNGNGWHGERSRSESRCCGFNLLINYYLMTATPAFV